MRSEYNVPSGAEKKRPEALRICFMRECENAGVIPRKQ
jgi:hypothetical protein